MLKGSGVSVGKGRLREASELARGLLEDPVYRERLRERLLGGELAPMLEGLMWHYAYGKPVEVVLVDEGRELVGMSDAELVELEGALRGLVGGVVKGALGDGGG